MPSSIQEAFQAFDKAISMNSKERSEAFSRARLICDSLVEELDARSCMVTGSLVKDTALVDLSDIDILVDLDQANSPAALAPQEALKIVASALSKHHPRTVVTNNAVHIALDAEFEIDVLPALSKFPSDKNSQSYWIPDNQNSRWIEYSPIEQQQQIELAATSVGSDFKSLIRIVKWWSKNHHEPIASYEIEAFSVAMFSDRIPELSRAINELLEALLAGPQRTSSAEIEVKKSIQVAKDALDLENQGQLTQASNAWRKILGAKFPLVWP